MDTVKDNSMAALAQPLPDQFETAMAQLQAIVEAMENQVLSLDDALQAYERGMQLSQICQQKLEAAQQRVQVLQDGQLQPLDSASASSLEVAQQPQGQQQLLHSDDDDDLF